MEFYRAALGRFGITGDLGLQSIASLSGGQKSRLAFALLGLAQPNMLILDEVRSISGCERGKLSFHFHTSADKSSGY